MLDHIGGRWKHPPIVIESRFVQMDLYRLFDPSLEPFGLPIEYPHIVQVYRMIRTVGVCLDTSDDVELGRLCLLNQAFRDLSVSPI